MGENAALIDGRGGVCYTPLSNEPAAVPRLISALFARQIAMIFPAQEGIGMSPAQSALHRCTGQEIFISPDGAEAVDSIPNTAVVLCTGDRIFVREMPEEAEGLIRKIRGRQP
jgi:uncharacterized protein YlzI (FlbEa/FlbD family)